MITNKNKLPFNDLQTLLPTPESRTYLSIFTGIPITKINNWFDPNSGVVPKTDKLILIASYFDCSTNYLLDLLEIQKLK